MVKPIIIVIGAIPVIVAILIAISMLSQPEIPFSAANPNDTITLEYTKHQLKKISFGVTERLSSQKTEILTIDDDGEVGYTLTEGGTLHPEVRSEINQEKILKIIALIKETGFMEIPENSFPVKENVDSYEKSTIKITLNGLTRQIHWTEQNATEKFIPPIITIVQAELNQIINELSK